MALYRNTGICYRKGMKKIDTLFLDIGGVLLTNGWDHHMRERAATQFGFDWQEFEEKHKQIYNQHEVGQISLDKYLDKVLFGKEREFSPMEFKAYMYAQTKPFPEMLNLIREVKEQFNLKVAIVSNEGRDLADYRIENFDLPSFADYFFISSYVHYQKPDPRIYQIALDVTHTNAESVLYIDDRPNLIEAAEKMGIQGIAHKNFETTREQLFPLFFKI